MRHVMEKYKSWNDIWWWILVFVGFDVYNHCIIDSELKQLCFDNQNWEWLKMLLYSREAFNFDEWWKIACYSNISYNLHGVKICISYPENKIILNTNFKYEIFPCSGFKAI